MTQAIIIDDEKKCALLLQKMLADQFPEIQIIGTYNQADEGVKAIRLYEPDLVFLDIEMPQKNGFEVLEATKDISYSIIFTTAYQQYAIKAIKYAALDYLLKPINEDDLKEAVFRFKQRSKLTEREQQLNTLFHSLKSNNPTRLSLATQEGVIIIAVSDILFLEASGPYTFFHIKNKEKYIVSKSLKDYDFLLENSQFFRIHHSYIVHLAEVKRYIKGDGGTVILSNDIELPVSKRKKEDFMKCLQAI